MVFSYVILSFPTVFSNHCTNSTVFYVRFVWSLIFQIKTGKIYKKTFCSLLTLCINCKKIISIFQLNFYTKAFFTRYFWLLNKLANYSISYLFMICLIDQQHLLILLFCALMEKGSGGRVCVCVCVWVYVCVWVCVCGWVCVWVCVCL